MSLKTRDTSDSDTFFVLVTGANAGIGYTICTRLISNFLVSRPSSKSICIIPTVRSEAKAHETTARISSFVDDLAAGIVEPLLNPRATKPGAWDVVSLEGRELWPNRVRVEPVRLDLCALTSVYNAARELGSRYSRIDVVICNAGIGGWSGISWVGLIKQTFTEGPWASLEAPSYKICRVGALAERQIMKVKSGKGEEVELEKVVDDDEDEEDDDEPKLAEVFCANLFGHYVFVHELLPLLYRLPQAERARVIWISTVEAHAKYFDDTDIQGFKSGQAYESSKRLTDILILGANPDQGEPNEWAKEYLTITDGSKKTQIKTRSKRVGAKKEEEVPPKMYLGHPGIVVTQILPIHPILVYLQTYLFILCRWVGGFWHNITTDNGVTAPVWLALEDEDVLEEADAEHKKWGSASGRRGEQKVIETPVEALGSSKFETLAEKSWMEMEELRVEWNNRMLQYEASQ